MKKIIPFEELAVLRAKHPGLRVTQCHGVFDLLHHGHLRHLESAKKYGDILVVTVTPDQFVNKGPGRPRFSQSQRMEMLAALHIVDYVALNASPRATSAIRALKPDFYVKGPDYAKKELDITGGILEEEGAVKEGGGQLVFTSDETESATELINQYFHQWDENQRTALEQVKNAASLNEILRYIEDFTSLRVLVIGEPIIDTYVFCQPEALSSKSPSISARFLRQEDYAGGSFAIANHLSALGCQTELLFTYGGEDYVQSVINRSVNPGVKMTPFITAGMPTPRKTRFVVPFQTQRVFEITDLRTDQWKSVHSEPFCDLIRSASKNCDLILIADFGHGMFEGKVLQEISTLRPFVAANVQTNSGNIGFNPFTKHQRFDYLSIDERECRIAMHDRLTNIHELVQKTVQEIIRRPTSVTLGADGSVYFDAEYHEYHCPSFFHDVVDTTGAGDAYFTITALLLKQGVPSPVIPFLGNCFAGLKTRIVGNKSAVSKVDLIRTVKSLLA